MNQSNHRTRPEIGRALTSSWLEIHQASLVAEATAWLACEPQGRDPEKVYEVIAAMMEGNRAILASAKASIEKVADELLMEAPYVAKA